MKAVLFLQLLCTFLFAILLLVIGGFLAAIPFVHASIAEFFANIMQSSWIYALTGYLIIVVALRLLMWTLSFFKKSSFTMQRGMLRISIEDGTLEQALIQFWREYCPAHTVATKVFIRKNKLHVIATVPPNACKPNACKPNESKQDTPKVDINNDIKTALAKFLYRHFGYGGDFSLSTIQR